MSIPSAIATGGAGSSAPDDYVKPRWPALITGVLAALIAFATFTNIELPWKLVKWCGGAPFGNARWGGVQLHWQPPPATDLYALQQRFMTHDLAALIHDAEPDGSVQVEIPRVPENQAAEVVGLVQTGALEFHEVIEGTSISWLVDHGLAFDDRDPSHREPMMDVDLWRSEDTGTRHTDAYLHAHTREVLEAALAEAERRGWSKPEHTHVAYELVTPSLDAKDRRSFWRTYLVRDEVALDGMSIASAAGSYDPNTNRPVVMIDFDREGGAVFGELTARIVGHKLAMVVGGNVRSAPVINGPIRGGRAMVTMGSSNPEREEHERDVLVATLRAGALPIGGKVIAWRWVPSSNGGAERIALVAVTAVAGLVTALVTFLLLAFARPQRRRSDVIAGTGKRWRRVLWTLGGVAIYAIGTRLDIPWIDDAELYHVMFKGAGKGGVPDTGWISIFGLGMTPLISAFIVVEVAASIVPPWRKYRDGSPERRRKLGFAVALLAMLCAFAQAYFITAYLQQMDQMGFGLIDPGTRWLVIATYVAGTMLLAVIASMIGARGIGNGYGVLMIAGFLIGIFDHWWFERPIVGGHIAFVAIVLVATTLVALSLLRWHVRAPRSAALPLPASGLGPLDPGAGLTMVLAQAVAIGIVAPAVIYDALTAATRGETRGLVVVLVAVAAWSFVFAWPGRRRDLLARANREPVTRDVWLRGVALTAGGMAMIYALAHAAKLVAPELAHFVDPLVLLFVVASAADVIAEYRSRRRDLVAVWALHDPLLVETAREKLEDIPHHFQATRLRTLTWLFGAFAPMLVLVPREDAERAAGVLRDWLDPA